MKVYEALYCANIHESGYDTLSIHMTKEGSERAINAHKEFIKKDFEINDDMRDVYGHPRSSFTWDYCQDWNIRETVILE